ncbi:M56 family metallopeptidase [Rhizosphaericola mali]|uniref:M56 family metallopeptidase n=1 Tax=Rhizosphaericola mali TaxID=2545455 RepID=A0A5P2G694_9BACT|nr:M56 family metallopeptidase [Rhizosphaericola mali]QES89442.1 M56 family metallopeptidase [Rhizosphaericola mali]
MNNLIIFLVKIIVASGVFTLFYVCCLSNLKSFRFNRFYLVTAIIFSLIIPAIHLPNWTEKATITQTQNFNFDNLISIYKLTPREVEISTTEPQQNEVIPTSKLQNQSNNLDIFPTSRWTKTKIIWLIYSIVTSLFIIQFIISLIGMFRLIRKNTKEKQGLNTFVYLHTETTPFTFFHYIFISTTFSHKDVSSEQILTHEKQHAKELHTIDLIFTKFIICFVWFNPFFYWLLKKMKENHEFLADKAVLQTQTSKANYQHLILNIQENFQPKKLALVHNFNFLTIKKRLTMMNSKNKPVKNTIFTLLGIGLLLASVIVFAQVKNGKKVLHNLIQSDEDKKQTSTTNQGISQEQFDYYISEMKKANFKFDPKNRERDLTKELQNNPNGDSLKSLYHQMSWQQKSLTQTKYHLFLIPTANNDSLTTADWESYKTLAKKLYEENRKKGADSAKSGGTGYVLNLKPRIIYRGVWIMDDDLYKKYGYLNVMSRNMSLYQKANTPQFIEILDRLDRPQPVSPTAAQLVKWSKNPTLWGVWLNEKRIPNRKLADYKPSDIYHFNASGLTPNAQKLDGFKVQLELYTKAGYETAYSDPKTWKN